MLAIRFPQSIEKRLDRLDRRTGRTKTYYVREAILKHLEDIEDLYLAERALERVRRGEERTIPLKDISNAMAWSVELSETAERELSKLDAQHGKGILKFLDQRVGKRDDPRSIGEALHGSRLGEFWKYRMGDYGLICRIEDDRLLVLVLRVSHRKEIYR